MRFTCVEGATVLAVRGESLICPSTGHSSPLVQLELI